MYGVRRTGKPPSQVLPTEKMVSLALRQRNLFGIFVLTFTFSGMMSLADIPEWIHKPALKKGGTRTLHARAPQPEDYPLDYRRVIAAYPKLCR